MDVIDLTSPPLPIVRKRKSEPVRYLLRFNFIITNYSAADRLALQECVTKYVCYKISDDNLEGFVIFWRPTSAESFMRQLKIPRFRMLVYPIASSQGSWRYAEDIMDDPYCFEFGDRPAPCPAHHSHRAISAGYVKTSLASAFDAVDGPAV